MFTRPIPTGVERTFREDEIIVSKTDTHGRITYANDVFLKVSGYHERDLMGQPHSMIRHPDMPRSVFKLLWDTLAQGREIFAYVNNLAAGGDHYWVLAHVTPSYGPDGRVVGYHSNRRVPYAPALPTIKQLYSALLSEERKHPGKQEGLAAGVALLQRVLSDRGIGYDEFVFSISKEA